MHYLDYESTYYNQREILFPLKRCPHQKNISDEKVSGTFELPPVIAPEFDESRKCPHGNIFDENNTHILKNVTLSCPTGGMLPRAACHWLTKSEFASYWLTQSATYSILPPAQASCCSTLDMLSSYIVRGTVRHKFALTFRTEI